VTDPLGQLPYTSPSLPTEADLAASDAALLSQQLTGSDAATAAIQQVANLLLHLIFDFNAAVAAAIGASSGGGVGIAPPTPILTDPGPGLAGLGVAWGQFADTFNTFLPGAADQANALAAQLGTGPMPPPVPPPVSPPPYGGGGPPQIQ
jgi:hypothetical protein